MRPFKWHSPEAEPNPRIREDILPGRGKPAWPHIPGEFIQLGDLYPTASLPTSQLGGCTPCGDLATDRRVTWSDGAMPGSEFLPQACTSNPRVGLAITLRPASIARYSPATEGTPSQAR